MDDKQILEGRVKRFVETIEAVCKEQGFILGVKSGVIEAIHTPCSDIANGNFVNFKTPSVRNWRFEWEK